MVRNRLCAVPFPRKANRPVARRDTPTVQQTGLAAFGSDLLNRMSLPAQPQAAKMAIACAGYRVVGAGHHRISFDVVKLPLGKMADQNRDYFDRCRRKRTVIDYDDAFVATETESTEILRKANEFADMVERWIAKNHPSLKA